MLVDMGNLEYVKISQKQVYYGNGLRESFRYPSIWKFDLFTVLKYDEAHE